MSPTPKISDAALADALTGDVQFLIDEVVEAVNDAPAEDFIGGSEMQVFRATELFRKKLFERAMQLRVEAAEAAFSPSGGPQGAAAQAGQQRPPNVQRPHRQR